MCRRSTASKPCTPRPWLRYTPRPAGCQCNPCTACRLCWKRWYKQRVCRIPYCRHHRSGTLLDETHEKVVIVGHARVESVFVVGRASAAGAGESQPRGPGSVGGPEGPFRGRRRRRRRAVAGILNLTHSEIASLSASVKSRITMSSTSLGLYSANKSMTK
jgi:hypothetical protein